MTKQQTPKQPSERQVEAASRALCHIHHGPNTDWPIGVNRNGYHQEPYVSTVPSWKWFHERDARAALTAALNVAKCGAP